MAEPYLAEIRLFGFNFPPRGWALCDGQTLSINQNQSLFSLLGTTYGGDGRTSFKLPDLRGRTPVHPGTEIDLGEITGEERHSLTLGEIPNHQHTPQGNDATASGSSAAGNFLAVTSGGRRPVTPYGPTSSRNQVDLNDGAVAFTGNGNGHQNMQPFLTVNMSIAISGTFPPRN